MNTLKQNELYQHLGEFLKGKGIELKDGSFTGAIRQGCSLITDAINCAQRGLSQAKGQVNEKLDRLRAIVHEKTAPKPATDAPAASAAPAAAEAPPPAAPEPAPASSPPTKQKRARRKAAASQRPSPRKSAARARRG